MRLSHEIGYQKENPAKEEKKYIYRLKCLKRIVNIEYAFQTENKLSNHIEKVWKKAFNVIDDKKR